MNHLPLGILGEVFGMFFHPRILNGYMVGYPVEPYLHAPLMGCSHKGFQVVHGAIGRIHVPEIH